MCRRIVVCCLLAAACSSGCSPLPLDGHPTPGDLLSSVTTWAYQIQSIAEAGSVDALANSTYDMLVVEPTRSDRDQADFDTAAMVWRLKATPGANGNRKLVIAYVDIGEAEDWRSYWAADWVAPTADEPGNPDFLLTVDPDGWAGNYPVAYWDPRWHDVVISAEGSALQQVLDDGFDGIYLDWVEAYDDEHVVSAADAAGLDPADEMIRFIADLRSAARARNPAFLVIQQNAPALAEGRPEALDVVDAIGQEDVWFAGDADVDWTDPAAGDVPTPTGGDPYTTEWYVQRLQQYRQAGKPVFTIDYALDQGHSANVYRDSRALGFVPFVSRTPLDRLP